MILKKKIIKKRKSIVSKILIELMKIKESMKKLLKMKKKSKK